jgi:hypothetical protein
VLEVPGSSIPLNSNELETRAPQMKRCWFAVSQGSEEEASTKVPVRMSHHGAKESCENEAPRFASEAIPFLRRKSGSRK